MNLLKSYFLYSLLLFTCMVAACEQEDTTTLSGRNLGGGPVYKVPGPQDPDRPKKISPTIIKEDFPQATGWRIIWKTNPDAYDYEEEYPTYFSTINGSLHSKKYLDATDPGNTAKVNMSLIYGYVTSPESDFNHHTPKYVDQANTTKFKRTGMTAVEFANYAQNNPAMFQTLFESDPFLESDYQPSRDDPGYEYSSWYDDGEIFTFKIESNPPRFGAVRIVDVGSPWTDPENDPTIIEVVVQKPAIDQVAFPSR